MEAVLSALEQYAVEVTVVVAVLAAGVVAFVVRARHAL